MTCSWNGGIRVRFWAESRLLLNNKPFRPAMLSTELRIKRV